jgi:glycopeptide antibiotics resistance protein
MLNLCGIVVAILKMVTARNFSTKIQHCSISKVAFDLFFKSVVSGVWET